MCMIVALALIHVEYLKEIVMVMMIALVISYAEKITVTILFHQMSIAATTLIRVSKDVASQVSIIRPGLIIYNFSEVPLVLVL